MIFLLRINFIFLAIILVVTSTGCTNQNTQIQDARSSINLTRQIEVYTAGYRNISEKYIKALDISRIAFGGIKGLSSIDPAVQTERKGNIIRLLLEGEEIASAKTPKTMDARGWGSLTANFEQAARQQSMAANRHDSLKRKRYLHR